MTPIPRRQLVRGAILGLAALGLALAVFVIAVVPPTPDSYYPKCSFYQLTRLYCPGCGTGRAVHCFLNGEVLRALRFNPFAVMALPVLLFAGARTGIRWFRGRPTASERLIGSRWIWLLLVGILLFWVLRNIPAYPFTLLAPNQLIAPLS